MSDPVRPEWLWDEKKVSDNLLMFNNPNSSEREQARAYIEHQEAERAKWLRKASDLAGDNAHLVAEKERQDARYGDLLAEFKRQSARIAEMKVLNRDYSDRHCADQARIAEMEAIERNLRESCEILKNMDAEKNTRIAELEARYVKDCEEITRLWERLGEYRRRIKELEKPPAERCQTCDQYSDACVCFCALEEPPADPDMEPHPEDDNGRDLEHFERDLGYDGGTANPPVARPVLGRSASRLPAKEAEPMCVCGHPKEDHFFGDNRDLYTPCKWECPCKNYKPEGGE